MNVKMNNTDLILAKLYTGFAFIMAMLGSINWQGILQALPSVAHAMTIGAGIMAIRHWYYATKKINKK